MQKKIFLFFVLNAILLPSLLISKTYYHSNGEQAWGGTKYSNVYHSNGEQAWDGNKNGKIYSENGNCLGTSDYCQIWLSNEWLLTVQSDGSFYLTMPITDELWLYISKDRISWEELAVIRSFNTVHSIH